MPFYLILILSPIWVVAIWRWLQKKKHGEPLPYVKTTTHFYYLCYSIYLCYVYLYAYPLIEENYASIGNLFVLLVLAAYLIGLGFFTFFLIDSWVCIWLSFSKNGSVVLSFVYALATSACFAFWAYYFLGGIAPDLLQQNIALRRNSPVTIESVSV